MNSSILLAIVLSILVLWLIQKNKECYRYNNYANMGSLTQEYIATHPNRRVSDYFAHCAPGEDC